MRNLRITSLLLLCCLCLKGLAATRTASQSGTWSSTATWGGSAAPIAGDVVVIDTYTVTVDISTAECASISLGTTVAATLAFNSGSKLTVSGNITLGGSGTKKGNLDFTNGGRLVAATFSNWAGTLTRGTGIVEVTGTMASFGSTDFWNWYTVILSGSANITLARNTAFYGNFTVGPGTTFTTGGNYVNLYGDLTINATATYNCGSTVNDYTVFHAANTQYVSGNATLHNVWANKTSNSPIVISGEITIRNTLWWDRGIFTYTGTGRLTLLSGYTDSNTARSNVRCFALPVKKIGSSAYTFPLCSGNGVNYSPLTISAPGTATDAFTAQYFPSNPSTGGFTTTSKESALDHVSTSEYWTLDRASGSASVTVTLSWGSWSGGVTSLPDLRVAKWNGSQWINVGNTATSGSISAGTVTSSSVSTFSPFTLASATGGGANPLPIELLSFTGACNGLSVVLKWNTATETNNDYFVVQRMGEGLYVEDLDVIEGAGNSQSVNNYSFSIKTPIHGVSFYRLKQVDYDGEFTYSDIISVEECEDGAFNVFPNLVDDIFTVVYTGSGTDTPLLFNMYGQRVHAPVTELGGRTVFDVTGLPNGQYLVTAILFGQRLSAPLIIHH